jgi:hypothetical protein
LNAVWLAVKKNGANQDEVCRHETPNRDLAEHYEQLRSDALSRPTDRAPAPGLALFLRQGMTAWMRTWSQIAAPKNTQAAAPETAALPSAGEPWPLDIRAQMTAILAGMILTQQLEGSR